LGPLTGEQVLYWTVSLVLFATAAFLLLFVQEELPPPDPGETTTILRPTRIPGLQWHGEPAGGFLKAMWKFVTNTFGERQALWVYALYACPVLSGIAIAPHPNYTLMITDQLGISKDAYGSTINTVSMLIMMLVFTPLAGFLADKVTRLLLLRVSIAGVALVQLGVFLHLHFFSHYQSGVGLILGTFIANAFFLSLMYSVWGPIVYDYIPSNKMGTYQAGIFFSSGFLMFLFMNAGGWWVEGWTNLFGPGGGHGNYNHASILVLAALLGGLALIPTVYFGRAEKAGRIRPEGRLETTPPANA
jgi:hypothetical protein